jgi:ribosomal protein S18 acetylase RimI-like enzyme
MNIDIRVLSDLEACGRISSCKDMGQFCVQISKLYSILSSHRFSVPATKESLTVFFVHAGQLVVALDKDETIVGMGMLILTYKGNETTARVEDVVVLESCRGLSVGERIMDALVEIALCYQVSHIDLTSRPDRVSANCLYEKLGFKKLDTNVRRLVLNTNT